MHRGILQMRKKKWTDCFRLQNDNIRVRSATATSRLLKKSLAASREQRVIAVVECQLDFECAVVVEFGRPSGDAYYFCDARADSDIQINVI